MSDARILHWLHSIPQGRSDDAQLPLGLRKRHLPSPPVSCSYPVGGKAGMENTPKRRRAEQADSTPRPARPASKFAGDEDESPSVESPISSRDSSKASKVSGSSSPRKQLRNAALQTTGFLVENFTFDGQPHSLKALMMDLTDISDGSGILPPSLQAELAEHARVPLAAFCNRQESCAFRYPSLTAVREIFGYADNCQRWQHGESSWNMEVHRRLLDHALRDIPADPCIDYRYCLSAEIERAYKPSNAPSKAVDFCIAIKPGKSEASKIRSLCPYRPGRSINHTDWGDLTEYPIAISIETKSDGEAYKPALLQISTWHAAQWRSLRWDGAVLDQIEFLAGIIAVGHDWDFVASILGQDGMPITLRSFRMGSTDSLFGIYKLLAALQRLKQWATELYWPAFKADVLRIAAAGG